MSQTRFAFVKAQWHADIVDRAFAGFQDSLGGEAVDVFDVPGALELPLMALKLAATGRYDAIACCAFVVDGGIYRHDFVSSAVVDGLVRVGLDSGIPILSVVLTPHHYQETEHHTAIFRDHFYSKGQEAGQGARAVVDAHKQI